MATPTSLPSGQGPQAQATSIGFLGTTAHLCARFGGSCHVGQLTAFGSATAVPQGSGTASTGVLSNNRNASALLFAACTLDTGQTVMTCWTSAMIAGTSTFVGTSVDSAYSGAPSNLVMAPFGSGQVALLMTVTPATGDSQLLGAYGVA